MGILHNISTSDVPPSFKAWLAAAFQSNDVMFNWANASLWQHQICWGFNSRLINRSNLLVENTVGSKQVGVFFFNNSGLSVLTEVRPVHGPAVSPVCCPGLEPFMALVWTAVWLMDDFWSPANRKGADFKQGFNFVPWKLRIVHEPCCSLVGLQLRCEYLLEEPLRRKIPIVSRRGVGSAAVLSVVLRVHPDDCALVWSAAVLFYCRPSLKIPPQV